MGKSIDDLDDDDIPQDAFTGDAPPAKSGKPCPTGPACPSCKQDDDGRPVRTWGNKTKNGHKYFRCSACKGCWWPKRDKPSQIDVASKWPPLPPRS
jgi:hypothetical protein